jgi:hypothetical protein
MPARTPSSLFVFGICLSGYPTESRQNHDAMEALDTASLDL